MPETRVPGEGWRCLLRIWAAESPVRSSHRLKDTQSIPGPEELQVICAAWHVACRRQSAALEQPCASQMRWPDWRRRSSCLPAGDRWTPESSLAYSDPGTPAFESGGCGTVPLHSPAHRGPAAGLRLAAKCAAEDSAGPTRTNPQASRRDVLQEREKAA